MGDEPHVGIESVPGFEGELAHKSSDKFATKDAFTDADKALIAALRDATAAMPVDPGDVEYWRSDHAMHRFLVARDNSVERAKDLYAIAMANRHAHTSSLLLTKTPSGAPVYSTPEVIRKCFPWGVVGLDKQGFPVLVERIGQIDLVGMEKAASTDEFVHWVSYYHEVQEALMRRVCEALGKNRHKMTCIIDMGGISMRHLSSATLNIIKRRARLEEDTYPEVVKRVFLINTPSLFATVWNVVKVFVDPGTQDKMRLLGGNHLPSLTQFIDPEVIPAYLGGKLVDEHGDPECKSLVGPGGLVPLSYLVGVGTDGRGLGEEVTVSHGRHSDVVVRVPAGATVSWRWGAQAHDALFSVTCVPAAAGAEAEAAAAGAGVLDVKASIAGVHQLAAGYSGPLPHGLRQPATPPVTWSKGVLADPIPGGAPGAAPLEGGHPAGKFTGHVGSYTLPAALPGGATHGVVRLRWDNSYAWVHGKTLARRVDVVLAGEAAGDAPTELARDEAEERASQREANIAAFPSPAQVAAFKARAAADAAAGADAGEGGSTP